MPLLWAHLATIPLRVFVRRAHSVCNSLNCEWNREKLEESRMDRCSRRHTHTSQTRSHTSETTFSLRLFSSTVATHTVFVAIRRILLRCAVKWFSIATDSSFCIIASPPNARCEFDPRKCMPCACAIWICPRVFLNSPLQTVIRRECLSFAYELWVNTAASVHHCLLSFVMEMCCSANRRGSACYQSCTRAKGSTMGRIHSVQQTTWHIDGDILA